MRKPWGKVGFAVRELMPEVLVLLAKGQNLSEIHKELMEGGKLECGFSTFTRHVGRFLKNPDPQNVVPLNPQAPATPAKKKKKTLPSNHEPPKFEYNRNVDLDYLLSPDDGSKPKEESEQ